MFHSSHVTRHTSHPRSARDGFALLITVTLLAFLVVLLVGLAAYTRVETAVAGNTQRQTQARQNALLGLNVALGQLQKSAGPDQRVTATADAFSTVNPHWTGVWNSTGTGAAADTWLVSGSELPNATIDPTKAVATANVIELVGKNSTGTAKSVVVAKQPIEGVGVPGVSGNVTIGNYAWWVGDQGVKASVALADPTVTAANFAYAPYTSAELRSRIRQQISLGAGPADTTGAAVFEPRDTTGSPINSQLVANGKVTAFNQIAFLKNSAATPSALGLAPLKTYFYSWSPNNFNVLANTKLGGLRQDLSLFSSSTTPSPLGTAYDAWANYDPATGGYMEDPKNPSTPAPLPAYGSDPIRRRYKITQPISSGNAGVAPVLTYFYVLLGVTKPNAISPYTISLRWAAALWNPYSSALVPEDLRLEVSGLPSSVVINARSSTDPVGSGTPDVPPVDLTASSSYGSPLKVKLPWDSTTAPTSDHQSWLSGRTYNWVSSADAAFAAGATNIGQFNSRSIPGLANGLLTTVNGGAANGDSMLTLTIPSQTILKVKLVRDSDGQVLATYTSPTYLAVNTTDEFQASGSTSPVGFIFRMAESFDTVGSDPSVWLTTPGRDVRSDDYPAAGLTTSPKSNNPTDCKNFTTISAANRFFDRDVTNGLSYNEDVPLFELPRSPILSLGQLQHFYLSGARPFAVGNSWGSGQQLNGIVGGELFDRFYFSGLVPSVSPVAVNGALLFPNPLLRALPRNPATGAALTVADVRGAPGGQSSKFLLQGGAFNINSVAVPAWSAVLRSGRFTIGTNFNVLNSDSTTATAADNATATPSGLAASAADQVTAAFYQTVTANLPTAAFFRFSQSAQETFKADDNYAQSTSNTTTTGPIIDTPLFRRGARTLSAAEIASLAKAIVVLIQQHHAANGPFRTLAEFLAPASAGSPSLLEQAITNTNLNGSISEFSSQFLTQADIMTALAPVLFPRSDTFVIRSYGEAVNPTTNATEGRAWCEAIVQRVPDYFDSSAASGDAAEIAPAALTNALNINFGRRFKIVSFRWLTRSDI